MHSCSRIESRYRLRDFLRGSKSSDVSISFERIALDLFPPKIRPRKSYDYFFMRNVIAGDVICIDNLSRNDKVARDKVASYHQRESDAR